MNFFLVQLKFFLVNTPKKMVDSRASNVEKLWRMSRHREMTRGLDRGIILRNFSNCDKICLTTMERHIYIIKII